MQEIKTGSEEKRTGLVNLQSCDDTCEAQVIGNTGPAEHRLEREAWESLRYNRCVFGEIDKHLWENSPAHN